MSRVLIIDGNEADRAATSRMLAAGGLEVDEVPDGVEAFENLLGLSCDAIVSEAEVARLPLDELLGKLRSRGVNVPVLVLSGITKTSAIAGLMKLGIAGYLPKGSPAEVLLQKVAELTGRGPASAALTSEPAPAPANDTVTASILMVDAVEDEPDKLRALFPSTIRVDACPAIKEGLVRARHGRYRMVLLDADAAAVNLGGVIAQMQVLQKEAAVVAIAKAKDAGDEPRLATSVAELGFDDLLLRPFQPAPVSLLCEHYCAPWEQLVRTEDDVIRVSRLRCRPDQRERYIGALGAGLEAALAPLSDACYDQAIVDLTGISRLVLVPDAAALISQVEKAARALGITVRVALPGELAAGMKGIDESLDKQGFRWFTSVAAARAA